MLKSIQITEIEYPNGTCQKAVEVQVTMPDGHVKCSSTPLARTAYTDERIITSDPQEVVDHIVAALRVFGMMPLVSDEPI